MGRKFDGRFWFDVANSRLGLVVGFLCLATLSVLVMTGTFQPGKPAVDASLTPVIDEDPLAATPRASDRRSDGRQLEPLASNALFIDGANGLDSNPGTVDAPILTPAAGFRLVEPGMTVYFRGGVYDDTKLGTNVIRQGGTEDNWVKVQPYPGEEVEIIAGGEYGNGFEISGAAYIEIRGFTITGRDDSTHGNGVTGNEQSHDIRVLDNRISGFGQSGISFVRSSRVTIEGNEIRNTAARSFWQGSGISLFEAEGPTDPVEAGFTNIIRSNYLVGNYNGVPSRKGVITDGNCIIVDFFDVESTPEYRGSTLVENNVCAENGGRGVHVFNSSNVMVRNNTLIGNGRSKGLSSAPAELVAVRASNVSFHNNLILNTAGVRAYFERDANNTVFEHNYALYDPPPGATNQALENDVRYITSRSGSQPVEAFVPVVGSDLIGVADPSNQPADDLLGRARPMPGSIGALEPNSS